MANDKQQQYDDIRGPILTRKQFAQLLKDRKAARKLQRRGTSK